MQLDLLDYIHKKCKEVLKPYTLTHKSGFDYFDMPKYIKVVNHTHIQKTLNTLYIINNLITL